MDTVKVFHIHAWELYVLHNFGCAGFIRYLILGVLLWRVHSEHSKKHWRCISGVAQLDCHRLLSWSSALTQQQIQAEMTWTSRVVVCPIRGISKNCGYKDHANWTSERKREGAVENCVITLPSLAVWGSGSLTCEAFEIEYFEIQCSMCQISRHVIDSEPCYLGSRGCSEEEADGTCAMNLLEKVQGWERGNCRRGSSTWTWRIADGRQNRGHWEQCPLEGVTEVCKGWRTYFKRNNEKVRPFW